MIFERCCSAELFGHYFIASNRRPRPRGESALRPVWLTCRAGHRPQRKAWPRGAPKRSVWLWQRRVAIHKKCVIWLTITPACQGVDAGDKYICDLRRLLADTAVIDALLVRDDGVS